MDAPKRIGLVFNGLGQCRLWARDEVGMGGVNEPDAEYILAAEHERLMAEARNKALEEAASVAATGWVSADYDVVGIADADTAMRLCEHIAATIRAMKGDAT